MRIGIAGLGRMGMPMAERLLAAGHTLAVWNRTPRPAAALSATIVAAPADLAGECDIVLTSLFDEGAVRSVYLGPDGLLARKLRGSLLIDTSTMPPSLAPELGAAITAAGGAFVDSPVLGSVGAARAGTLIALAGGAREMVARSRPVLEAFARAVHCLGDSGSGYAGKLAINLLKGTYWAALGDCMALGQRYGIAPAAILNIIESGPGALVELPLKLPVLRGEQTEPAFDIIGAQKDMRAIVAAGGGLDHVPVAAGALRAVERAVAGGWANRDIAAVALFAAAQIAAEPDVA